MASLLWVTFIAQAVIGVQGFFQVGSPRHVKLKTREANVASDAAGEPLFLTPYITKGRAAEGRELARVTLDGLSIESYSGFFTVNETYNSNQFFWYFPSIREAKETAPVLVWLQGGPGCSSMFGLFMENGPILIDNKGGFALREHHWALNHHLIYIDNPVGAGFSFTDENGYCNDETQVGEQLHSTVTQFFQLFPELQKNKFFVSGESYAGKYVPALAYTIHKKNPTAETKINLQGIAIGDGWSDPEHQMVYSEFLYQIGLIDWKTKKEFETYQAKAVEAIKEGSEEVLQYFSKIVEGFHHLTYNYWPSATVDIDGNYSSVLDKAAVRKSIHVGNLEFDDFSEPVHSHLSFEKYISSVAPWISELLDHYSVVTYNGQFDVIVAYPLTVNFLRNLRFNGSEEYKTAKRQTWEVDGELAGFTKTAGRLTEVLVRGAGHMVPADQPVWALDLITRVTHDGFKDKTRLTTFYEVLNAQIAEAGWQ